MKAAKRDVRERERVMDIALELFNVSGASIETVHAAALCLYVDAMDRLLSEAAAVDATASVKEWLSLHLDHLRLFVDGWQPGQRSPGAALVSSTRHDRVH